MQRKYFIGEKHNHMTLIILHHKKRGGNLWKVKCDCGNIIICTANDVRSGHTKSCGCMKSKWLRISNTIHGMESSKEYGIWLGMRSRCLNVNNKKYPLYGGRGIKICDSWNDFEKFYIDMGSRPDNTSIDRIDVNGNYEPSNCRWASPMVQSNNRNYNKNVILYGEKLSCTQAAKKMGIYKTSIFQRAKDFYQTNQQACEHFAKKINIKSLKNSRSIIEETMRRISA